MTKLATTYHISFFQEGQTIDLRGIIKFGAKELILFVPSEDASRVSSEIKRAVAIHEITLPIHVGERCEKMHETLDTFAFQHDVFSCVNVTGADPLDVAHITTALQAGLERFHKQARPTVGNCASAMLYMCKDQEIIGHPFITTKDETVQHIYWDLISTGEWSTKRGILDMLTDVDDSYIMDDVTDAMIIMENWLHFYPGFFKEAKNRENNYRIIPLEQIPS